MADLRIACGFLQMVLRLLHVFFGRMYEGFIFHHSFLQFFSDQTTSCQLFQVGFGRLVVVMMDLRGWRWCWRVVRQELTVDRVQVLLVVEPSCLLLLFALDFLGPGHSAEQLGCVLGDDSPTLLVPEGAVAAFGWSWVVGKGCWCCFLAQPFLVLAASCGGAGFPAGSLRWWLLLLQLLCCCFDVWRSGWWRSCFVGCLRRARLGMRNGPWLLLGCLDIARNPVWAWSFCWCLEVKWWCLDWWLFFCGCWACR